MRQKGLQGAEPCGKPRRTTRADPTAHVSALLVGLVAEDSAADDPCGGIGVREPVLAIH
jgi:hypothetical protein